MPSPPDYRTMLRETSPVVVILLFWLVLGEFANQSVIATGLLYAGLLMALLYTIVRGATLAGSRSPTPQPTDLDGILRENVKVVRLAGVWFFSAFLINVIDQVVRAFSGPHGVVLTAIEFLTFALTGAGVAVVLLYVISVGWPRVRGASPDRGTDTAGTTPAED